MLTVVGLVAALILSPVSLHATSCDSASNLITACVSNSGTQVDIGASNTTRAPSTSHAYRDPDSPALPNPAPAVPATQNPAPAAPEDCPLNRCDLPYTVVAPPDVTLADLASFRPARPTLGGEPSGFGVVGMPANVFAAASEQRLSGTLLGWDVTVRFVPAGFVFHYGDGSAARTSTGGATWQQLGLAQFTPTATSHVYGARGTYAVSVEVEYSASVDFGSGTWRPVAGYVTAESGGYDVRVVEVSTALVDKTCIENPRGPGC